MCTSTAFIKAREHPEVEEKARQPVLWSDLWLEAGPEDRALITSAWCSARDALRDLRPGDRWQRVKGPNAATIAVLLDAGWGPHRPDHWTTNKGTNYRIGASPGSAVIIGMAFRDCTADLAWSRAAGHFMGGGLEAGAPDYSIVDKVVKELRSDGHHTRAEALLAAATGGSTCGARLHPSVVWSMLH